MNETTQAAGHVVAPAVSLDEALRNRRSIRRFRPDRVEREVLDRLFERASLAPSAHNRQPWRYAVTEDAPMKARLAAEMGGQLRQDRLRDGDAAEEVERDVARSYARLTDAPVLIVACATLSEMDSYADDRRQAAEAMMAAQSTAMATQNLLLAAYAEGLGACWICAPLFCPETVRAVLGIPGDWRPQGLVALGHPGETKPMRTRRPPQGFVRFLSGPA